QLQVERPMPRKQLQHVIEEPYPGRHLVLPLPLDGQMNEYPRLSSIPFHHARPQFHRGRLRYTRPLRRLLQRRHLSFPSINCWVPLVSILRPGRPRNLFTYPIATIVLFNASAAFTICSRVPIVIRTLPSHPGSFDRSRTSTPSAFIFFTKFACCAPISTSTKFARLGHRRNPTAPIAASN